MSDQVQSSEVRGFLHGNVASQREPAFDTRGLHYDSLTEPHWVAPDGLQARVALRNARFVNTMEEFKQNNPKLKREGFDIRGAHNWSEVLDVAQSAQKRYGDKSKGVKGLLTRAGRNVSAAAPAIGTILDATLPCGEYSSLVSGGVILIFKAFDAVDEVREMVAKTLSDSPVLLEHVERLMNIYPEKQTLRNSAVEVHIALLAAIEGVIGWLGKHSINRFKAVILQDRYEHQLKDLISALQDSTAKLKAEAELCHQEKTQSTAADVDRIQLDTNVLLEQSIQLLLITSNIDAGIQNIDHRINGVGTKIEGMNSAVLEVHEGVHDIDAEVRKLRENQQQMEQQLSRQIDAANHSVVEALSQMLLQHNIYLPTLQPVNGVMGFQNAHMIPSISPEDIMHILGDWREFNSSLIRYYSTVASDAGPSVAASITSSSQLSSWLASPTSQILTVSYDLIDEQVQPGSYVTAALSRALSQRQPSICITHFCCKRSQLDSPNPVANMLSCLISGILCSSGVDLTRWADIESRRMHEFHLQNRDLGYLCSLLKHLITLLRGEIVFFLIDDFKDLERESDRGSLTLALQKLQQAVESCLWTNNAVLKILFMTTSSRYGISAYVESQVFSQQLFVESPRQRRGSFDD